MAKATTAFERFKERRRLAGMDTEEKFLNPLDVRVGDVVTLDALDLRDLDFQVTQFRVVNRLIGGREFPLVDYYLRHRSITHKSAEIHYLLRFIPLDDPDPAAGLTHTTFLLHMVEESEHNDAVLAVLAEDNGYTYHTEKVADEATGDVEWEPQEFPSRVNDISLPYDCQVDIVKDENHDGEVEDDEVESHKLTLWDFWRVISVEGGDDVTEYLFVEIDQEDGWTELFVGTEVDQAIVTKL